jgi:hypothetical protein
MTGFKMPTGASSGYVLTSDENGVGTWQPGGDNDWIVSGANMVSTPTVTHININATLDVGEDDTGYDVNFYGQNSGSRFFWSESRMALRAGIDTEGTHWNEENIGEYSIAFGYNTKSSGSYSTAMGHHTTASGWNSTAMGFFSEASGMNSTAIGSYAKARRSFSIAIGGFGVYADGPYSTAMGYLTRASGYCSTAMGEGTKASERHSTAMGKGTTASGNCSTAMGEGSTASGSYSTAMGYRTTASGSCSTAMGGYTTASGWFSTAIGRGIEVSGEYSVGIALSDQSGTNITQNNTMAIMGGKVGIGITSPQQTLHIKDVLRLEPQASAPAGGLGGLYAGTDGKLYFHNGTEWKEVSLVP